MSASTTAASGQASELTSDATNCFVSTPASCRVIGLNVGRNPLESPNRWTVGRLKARPHGPNPFSVSSILVDAQSDRLRRSKWAVRRGSQNDVRVGRIIQSQTHQAR